MPKTDPTLNLTHNPNLNPKAKTGRNPIPDHNLKPYT